MARGDQRRLQMPRGMRLLSLGGPVLVGGDGVPAQRLDDGETLVIEHRTWVTLTAWSDAELMCLPPPPPRTGWRRLLDALPFASASTSTS